MEELEYILIGLDSDYLVYVVYDRKELIKVSELFDHILNFKAHVNLISDSISINTISRECSVT